MGGDDAIATSLRAIGVLALVCLNGFFVAAEFAFVKLRKTQVEALVTQGHRRARIALRLVNNVEACISATQMGITLCGLATGALIKPVFQAVLSPLFDLLHVESAAIRTTAEFLVGFLVSTFLLIVVGELVPKSLAIRRTLSTSLRVAEPLAWFYRLAFPFIWVLNHAAQWVLTRLGIQAASEAEQSHSEEELRLLFASSSRPSQAELLGRNIVLNAFDLRRRVVREVMRPRREIVVLNDQASLQECLELADRTRYSRFPLCQQGNIDRTLGVIHIKDLYALRHKARCGADLLPVARKIIYVPETARLERLLHLFLDRKLHLAIVVDEYGGTLGMVTLENVLEDLVGQIQDEFDQEKPLVAKIGDQCWEMQGELPLRGLSELVGFSLAEEGITTTSGLVTHQLGGFPRVGDEVVLGAYRLQVEETDGLRVARLRLTRLPEAEAKPIPPA